MTQALQTTKNNQVIGMNMRDLNDAAALIFNSKVFGDLQTQEAAAVKIIAGAEKGFTPFQSMAMFDFIQGRPTLNAHGKATLINSSGDFRLKIKELTNTVCVIDVCRKNDQGEWKVINTSSFTIEDAAAAELTTGNNKHSWKKYPRNMLFARCVSNIWRWDCAELNTRKLAAEQINEFSMPELEDEAVVDVPDGDVIDAEIVETDPVESKSADLMIAIGDLFSSKLGGDADEIAKALGGQDLSQMSLEGLEKLHGDLAAM